MYAGRNYEFSGTEFFPLRFSSLDLPFGTFYKTQLLPAITHQQTSIWYPFKKVTTQLNFLYKEPYFTKEIKDFGTNQLRIFFKFTNDNNPFTEVTVMP